MTRPTPNHPTVRLSSSSYRGSEIVVELHPTWMALRLKRSRVRYSLDYVAAYQFAARKQAEKVAAERKLARKRKPK